MVSGLIAEGMIMTKINRPSRLILAAIEGGYYKPGRGGEVGSSPYLCNALHLVQDTDRRTIDETRTLISERIEGYSTLSGYLHGTRQGYVSWADRLDFWAEFVRELEQQETHFTELHDALVALRNRVAEGTHLEGMGICNQLYLKGDKSLSYASSKLLRQLNNQWPSNSGHSTYPVPHPFLSPDGAYFEAPDMWDTNSSLGHSAYATARRDLLDYLIEETA